MLLNLSILIHTMGTIKVLIMVDSFPRQGGHGCFPPMQVHDDEMGVTASLQCSKLRCEGSVPHSSPVPLTFQKDLQVDLAMATMAVRRVGDVAVVGAFVF